MQKYLTHRQYYGYFLIAGLCSLIDLGVLYALTELVGLMYLLSATVGFILAQVVNYYLNRKLNFRSRSKRIAKQLAVFIAVNTLGLGISLAVLAFLVEVIGLWYIFSRIISMLIAFNSNYFFHKRYTFVIFE